MNRILHIRLENEANYSTKKSTIKKVEADIQLKTDAKLIQQKGRPILIHLQPAVAK